MSQVEPPAKMTATPAEDDEDDNTDLFGSDNEEEEEKEAARLREEQLRRYAVMAKKPAQRAKKPALVAKSSILPDVKPWDDETDMALLEACVRPIQRDGLLEIQCVEEDHKVGTDFLEEEITKFEEHVPPECRRLRSTRSEA
ncbi:hypothetical protein P7K49_025396 [Saguinus oedipus]|uniref:Translation elongation factor EF1B beta/delta subunit guanine nucleotide exchange domain-containing protein n=1 Tax=Saguinus oedipus TaxID=9490 RepID=A0ABQ9UH04_SAGOE|nr:hypothetical protein P7K49_025396 [Saguinus oedipus]